MKHRFELVMGGLFCVKCGFQLSQTQSERYLWGITQRSAKLNRLSDGCTGYPSKHRKEGTQCVETN